MLVSVPLARLCGAIALWQMSQGRHVIVEQPAGSKLFLLEEWQKLAEDRSKSEDLTNLMAKMELREEEMSNNISSLKSWFRSPRK